MGGVVSLGMIGQLVGAVAPLLAGGSSAPAPAAPPPPPAVAPAPVAPQVAEASDTVGQEPVVDTEAARVRASKRRKAAEDERLFSLSDSSDSVVLTKSLLGD